MQLLEGDAIASLRAEMGSQVLLQGLPSIEMEGAIAYDAKGFALEVHFDNSLGSRPFH